MLFTQFNLQSLVLVYSFSHTGKRTVVGCSSQDGGLTQMLALYCSTNSGTKFAQAHLSPTSHTISPMSATDKLFHMFIEKAKPVIYQTLTTACIAYHSFERKPTVVATELRTILLLTKSFSSRASTR